MVPPWPVSGKGSLSCLQMAAFSLCPHMTERVGLKVGGKEGMVNLCSVASLLTNLLTNPITQAPSS